MNLLRETDGNVRRAEVGHGKGGRPDKRSAAIKKGEPTAPAAASLICAFGGLYLAFLCFVEECNLLRSPR